ncbi:MAG TPA: glycosyltransferase family 4 protein [Chloroflexia bacterium]|nr:glycosyltransferase family 4 protein [Chloroflexia bacterium]
MTADKKLKLAYFSPLNPVQSGISDYSEELLPALARYAEIDLYVDNYTPSNNEITTQFAVYPATKFSRQAGRYDTFLFHMGNSAAHAYIYRALQETAGQGVLVLHDFVLHHFLIGQYLNNGKAAEYVRLMARHYGAPGEAIAREVIKGKLAEVLFNYPLNESAIEAARGVLVHSLYAAEKVKSAYLAKTVGVARMGVPLPKLVTKAEARARLGLPDNEFILVSLGHLNPYKRLDSALWAYRAFRREYPRSRFVLVGSPSPNYDVRSMISALGLEKNVFLTGYASQADSRDYLAAADVCVNLRYPTAGETSASLLRIMGAGRPVLVSRTGAFEELPDDSCIKVDVDDAEEELLLEYLRALARQPELAYTLGRNARRHVALNARVEDAAHDYYLFLCGLLGKAPVIEAAAHEDKPELEIPYEPFVPSRVEPQPQTEEETSLLGELARAMVDIGMDEEDPALESISQAARFSGIGKA